MAVELLSGDALDLTSAMPERSVDLVFTSPPYEDARTYEAGMPGQKKFKLKGQRWVDWLAPIVVECARVSRGLVCVNMASPVKRFRYTAAVEWLVTDLTRVHGLVCGPSPYAWFKGAGIPGSGSLHYHRRDWEPIYAFALPDRLPLAWSDNTAFGHPPKWAPGGEMSHRLSSGARVNQWGRTGSQDTGGTAETRKNGAKGIKSRPSHRIVTLQRHGMHSQESTFYSEPDIANPGNVIRADVGGNKLGSANAHAGEAPMPVAVAERFVCWYCPEGGKVLDPFCGTGTTLVAAVAHRRNAVGFDIRPGQLEIVRRRLRETTPAMV